MLAILVAVLAAQVSAPQAAPASDLRQLTLSTPTVLAEIDTTRLQGDPVGLAWNADGTVYLRVARGKTGAGHYLIATTTPVSFGQADQVPAWAAEYWEWKSAMAAPGDPSLKIDTEKRRDRATSVNTVSGGELAGMQAGGADPTGGGEGIDNSSLAKSLQNIIYTILTLTNKLRSDNTFLCVKTFSCHPCSHGCRIACNARHGVGCGYFIVAVKKIILKAGSFPVYNSIYLYLHNSNIGFAGH
jgi:hypothetical protein